MHETHGCTETNDLAPICILVVDDDALARFILADQLAALGYRCVDTAEDGRQALHFALNGHYDLVITDMCMPRMGGRALLLALRAHGLGMPVIAGTAWSENASARPAKATPGVTPIDEFAAVVRKPFAMSQLRGLLSAHIGGVPLARRRGRPASATRRALREAFAAAWPEDETALRTAAAALDEASMLERLHRLQGALAVAGESQARQACARLQQRVRAHGIEASVGRIERFLRQCARIGDGLHDP
jgi:two-component system capsular synthesis sensor histidine kinase RcsC